MGVITYPCWDFIEFADYTREVSLYMVMADDAREFGQPTLF